MYEGWGLSHGNYYYKIVFIWLNIIYIIILFIYCIYLNIILMWGNKIAADLIPNPRIFIICRCPWRHRYFGFISKHFAN